MGLFTKKTEKETAKPAASKAPAKKEEIKEEGKSMKDLYGEGETTAKTVAGKKTETKKKTGNAYRVLAKPLVTEKVTNLGVENKYVFAVNKNANKIEVAKAIFQVYGIKPVKINIINMMGKNTRYGRTQGKRKDWKKAVVTLPEGQTIKVYEGV